jgi:AraC-like DNA-binding protein
MDPKVAQVLSYINAHLDGDLSVAGLAGLVYTSKYHFMRRFRAQTGYSVHQYVLEKRLLAAAALLRAGTPAQQAGLRCGFQDYSAFYRAFKRQFGVPPRQFGEV